MKTLLCLFIALAMPAAAFCCDGYSFSAVSCYVAPVQAYAAPVYAQPVVQYAQPQIAYSAPQQVILPAQVTVTRPAYSLQIQQAYAAPVVQQYVQPVQKVYAQPVQKFVQPVYGYNSGAAVRLKVGAGVGNNTVVDVDRGLFGRTTITEADGDRKTFNAFGRRVR